MSSKRIPVVKKLCLEATHNLAERLKLNKTMIEQLMILYREALFSSEFNQCPYEKKVKLGGVCAFLVMLKNEWTIPIDRICNELNCTSSEFNHIYNRFIQTFPNQKPTHRPISELIPFMMNEINIEKEEKKTIEKRVLELVNILKSVYSIEGLRPLSLIYAVIFITWQSIKPVERNKVKLKEFCKKHLIEDNRTTTIRYREIVNHLALLLKDLPWIKTSIDEIKKRIPFYIIDILNYSNSLIYHYQEKNPLKYNVVTESDLKSLIDQESKSVQEKEDPAISDSEINLYIRCEDEIKVIKELKEFQKARK